MLKPIIEIAQSFGTIPVVSIAQHTVLRIIFSRRHKKSTFSLIFYDTYSRTGYSGKTNRIPVIRIVKPTERISLSGFQCIFNRIKSTNIHGIDHFQTYWFAYFIIQKIKGFRQFMYKSCRNQIHLMFLSIKDIQISIMGRKYPGAMRDQLSQSRFYLRNETSFILHTFSPH